ncbi:MetQ/NlpA family ABC transporter substrate-binding protein [Thalassobacillus pellis]|uniref:MetQ/NlpA family ABC transporter substrate-binding protein n=1 Tax=Thalassobacillus pellis TaxID=748008 RepID=UPI001960EC83|nr:MetQ/NlpA family ABC transporter substrate-binding protein [Thalassobacillus pellis]MBM7551989.1 D-methionine transport system substrate-binding protein [Thalassobacillus pellis]
MKNILLFLVIISSISLLAACGSGGSSAEGKEDKNIRIGATAGPYSDMVKKAIKPGLEEKGYTVEVVEFSDYIQPNMALDKGALDANLFQHKIYMDTFAKQHGMKLSGLVIVPTAPMGIYSNKFTSIEQIKEGASIAVPNDPTNAARAFLILEDQGLVKLDPEANPLTVSEKDIIENKKNLKFQPIEAGQLPRAVEGTDLAAVPGNYALAAKMDLQEALALENMPDDYRNRVVVKTENKDSQLAKDIIEVVKADQFEKVIDEEFKGFGKPKWME